MELNPNYRQNHLTEWGVGVCPDEILSLVDNVAGKFDGTYPVEDKNAKNMVEGRATAPGIALGRAVFIKDHDDLQKATPDSILIYSRMSPVHSIVFSKVRGIISEGGGVMSTPATIAREKGLPVVTGVESVEKIISDGDLILLNGTDGNIQLISKSSKRTG